VASVPLSTLHTRVATRVATVSGYVEALWPLDPSGSAESVADKAFAVELEPRVERLTREQDGELALVDTDVVIRFLRVVSPLDQITTLKAGYDDAHSIVQALMAQQAQAWNDGLRVRYTAGPAVERLAGGDYLLYTLRFNIRHHLTF